MYKIDTLIHSIVAVSDDELPKTVPAVRQCIKAFCPSLPTDGAWLIGTDGCHLCDDVEKMYQMVAKRLPLPKLCVIDVLDLDDKITKIIAPHIPVLIGFDGLLVYPFGVLDIGAWAVGVVDG